MKITVPSLIGQPSSLIPLGRLVSVILRMDRAFFAVLVRRIAAAETTVL